LDEARTQTNDEPAAGRSGVTVGVRREAVGLTVEKAERKFEERPSGRL